MRTIGATGCWLLPAIAASCLAASDVDVTGRDAFTKHWWERLRPAETNATAQLEHANGLRKAGRLRRASSEYRALVYNWPDSPEAPSAQLKYADSLKRRRKHADAFGAYQVLMEVYAGFFPYEEVIARQLAIADHLASRQRRFLFFKYAAPREAIPFFKKLLRNCPLCDGVSDLQYRIGEIHQDAGEYVDAIHAYQKYLETHPFGAAAEQASYGRASAYYRLARMSPNDRGLREYSRAALEHFLARYPESDKAGRARVRLEELVDAQGAEYYREARTYEKNAGRARDGERVNMLLTAAETIYGRLVNEFPESRWAQMALARIENIDRRTVKTP